MIITTAPSAWPPHIIPRVVTGRVGAVLMAVLLVGALLAAVRPAAATELFGPAPVAGGARLAAPAAATVGWPAGLIDADGLRRKFDSLDYDLDLVRRGDLRVPRIFVAVLPGDLKAVRAFIESTEHLFRGACGNRHVDFIAHKPRGA